VTDCVVLSTEIEPGQYVCLRTKSALGAVVRAFCHSPYDHVVVATGGGMCVQATIRGVKESPLVDFRGCQAVVSTDRMTQAHSKAIVAKARSYVDDEYGWQYLPVIATRLAGVKWNWLVRVSQDQDAMICSELAVLAGAAGGYDWLCGEPLASCVRPCQLAVRRSVAPVVWA
jgi:uncharacterized protein YycO